MTPIAPAAGTRLWRVRTQIGLLGAAIMVVGGMVMAGDALVLRFARDRFESEDTRTAESRARIALSEGIEADRKRITETAWWDELYDWVDHTHAKLPDRFLRENLIDWLPKQYGDRYLGLWRPDGAPLFEWNDSNTVSLVGGLPLSTIFARLDREQAIAGLITHGGRIFQLTGALILPNGGTSTPHASRGYVIAVRPMNDTAMARLGTTLQQQVRLRPALGASLATSRFLYAGRDSASTSFSVADLFGRRSIAMEVRTSRSFLAESERWMARSMLMALLAGLACLALLAVITSRLLLRPFARINAEFAAMHAEGRFGKLQTTPMAREWALFLESFNQLAEGRERAERELAAARDEAVASTRAKSDFLANMSHEIRTPMNAILGLSDLLRRTPLADEQRRYVEAVHGSGEALLTLINDILDLSKVEAGKLTIETVPFDLHRAVAETVAIFTHRAAERGVRLVEEIDPGVPERVLGDPGRVRQVLTNLVGNALKFTREGQVVVRLAADGTGDETVIWFEIEDTGIGIPADKLGRIFEKFAQADASTTRKFGGTGLGLSISRQLVELMGGEMTVRSEVGKGSTFAFTVPLPACAGVPAQLPRDYPLGGLRVLQVSADGIPDPAITSQLVAEGLRVSEAAAYVPLEEALLAAAADELPFHFVVIEGEQMSPAVQHAISACHRELWPAVAVVALIRRGYRGRASHARVAGAHACLVDAGPATDLREALAVARQVVQGGLTWPLITRHWLLEVRAGAEESADQVAALVTAPGTRVLVTDDNELNRLVASEYLRRLGAEVVTAASGAEAVARIAEGGIDLVFMDCQMPEQDGYETTALIRALGGGLGGVPVVAMTANAMQGDRERCLAAGMNDYVSKPIREADVSRSLRRWCGSTAAEHTPVAAIVPPTPAGAAISAGSMESLVSSGPGGAGLATRLTALYLRDTPAQLDALETAIAAEAWADAVRIAHTLRGASGVMGAHGVVELAARVEDAAQRERGGEALEAFQVLGREAARAMEALGAGGAERPPISATKLEEYRCLEAEAPGLSATVFQLFLRDAPGRVTAMEAALALEDVQALRDVTHALRGAALQLGASGLGQIVTEIESDVRRNDLATARARFPGMIREWDRVREALTGELARLGAQPSMAG